MGSHIEIAVHIGGHRHTAFVGVFAVVAPVVEAFAVAVFVVASVVVASVVVACAVEPHPDMACVAGHLAACHVEALPWVAWIEAQAFVVAFVAALAGKLADHWNEPIEAEFAEPSVEGAHKAVRRPQTGQEMDMPKVHSQALVAAVS